MNTARHLEILESLDAARANFKPAPEPMKTNAKFAPGDKLETRSLCDHDCIYRATIVSRTKKSVMVDLGAHKGGIVRRGLLIDSYTGNEYFYPYGRYSMAPSFRPPLERPFDNPLDVEPVLESEALPTNIIPFRAA
jgi:hypothetical protein